LSGKPVCLENRETLEVLQKAYSLTKITTLDPVVTLELLREGFPPGGDGRAYRGRFFTQRVSWSEIRNKRDLFWGKLGSSPC
jgi:hypothetical protein